MKVNVLFYASAAERVGMNRWDATLAPGSTLEDMKRVLADRHPACAEWLSRCRVAVNLACVQGNPALKEADEISFFPQVIES